MSFFSLSPQRLDRCGLRALGGLLLMLSVAALGAAEPVNYYNSTAGLTGSALRTALNTIIRTGHSVVSYTNARFALETIDQDPLDSTRLILIYSGESKHKTNDWVTNNSADGWNREHMWPNSYGIDDIGAAYSDLHHLRPCDENVNSDRNNNYYDESDPGFSGYVNPANVEAPLCTQDSNSWEPPLNEKGDIARAMFYMDVRYEGISGEPNLQLTDNTSLINSSSAYMGRLTTLLVWHFLDPVSAAEKLRNDRVHTAQGNRNPFVDRPEFVERLFGDVMKLGITRSGGNLQLQWPSQVQDIMGVVEETTNLSSWTTVSGTPVVGGGIKTLSFTLPASARFYRFRVMPRSG
ncbi:MAG: endonuclease [Verrucomicrobiota bacterium]